MTPLTYHQKRMISQNILAACKDIKKLNSVGYGFIYICSGFIAHNNIQGFKEYYSDHSLQDDIERNAKSNQWSNFLPGERNYDYYMEKRDCYNMILGGLVADFAKDHFHFVVIR